jgi:hypothetical protein
MKSPDRYIEWWSSKTAYLRSRRTETEKALLHLRATWSFGPGEGHLELWPATDVESALYFRVNSKSQADRIARDFIGFGILPTVAPHPHKSARAAVRRYRFFGRDEAGSPSYFRHAIARRRAARAFMVIP